jgi:hypothetical protein
MNKHGSFSSTHIKYYFTFPISALTRHVDYFRGTAALPQSELSTEAQHSAVLCAYSPKGDENMPR